MNDLAKYHGDCPFITTVSEMRMEVSALIKTLEEVRLDVKVIRDDLHALDLIQLKQTQQDDTFARVFVALDSVSEKVEQHSKWFDRLHGMQTAIIVVWTVLAGGLGAVALKVYKFLE